MVTLKQQLPRRDDQTIDLENWFELRFSHFPEQKKSLIHHACQLSQLSCHTLQHPFGSPCFEEGLKMADILLSLDLDIDAIATAIICNAILYGDLNIEDIEEHLGKNVATLTAGFLKMGALNTAATQDHKTDHINNIRKMVLAMVSDVRVVLIKLAERICLMRSIKFLKTDEATKIAKETRDIYAPLANRLGISQMKWELEDLCFFYLDNEKYKHIAALLNEKRIDRDDRLETIKADINTLLADLSIKAEVSGRSKHIYSIYQKMQRKSLSLQEIYDVSALRIIVDSIEDCYAILAAIHDKWQYISTEFDDYIANPKPNGYQSIHTVIIGPDHKQFEIQIRTHKMHEEGELGFAAHWVYKEGKRRESSSYEEKITRLRQLLEWHKEIAHGDQPIEKFHDTVFEDRVYVFTPDGDIVDLAKGATPLDFAYLIHSSIGHRCRGAKINNRIVPLTYALNTGETISVLTSKAGSPSRDWLNPQLGYITTARARAKIQHWFNLQDHDHHIAIGEDLLNKEMVKLNLRDINLKKLAERLHYDTPDDMIIALGRGNLRVGQLNQALTAEKKPVKTEIITLHHEHQDKATDIIIEGVGNLLTYFASCCKPIIGDDIVGYITQGRGIAIHRTNCRNIQALLDKNKDRLIEISWGQKAIKFKADLKIKAEDRPHLLRDIVGVLTNENINLMNVNSAIRKVYTDIKLTVEIGDLAQLHRVSEKLSLIHGVIAIQRG